MRYAEQPTVQAETFIDAEPATVWELVTDIELIASLSTELQEAQWLDEGSEPAVGRRFRGRNFHKLVGEWETTSHVVECDRPAGFAWAVHDPENPAAMWRFQLRPQSGGTVLSQWARLGPGRSNLSVAIERTPDREEAIVASRLRELRTGIETNLAELKKLAERAA